MIRFEVLGLQSTVAKFARLAAVAEVSKSVIASDEAEKVQQEAKALAPVDTGTLRDSIAIADESPGVKRVGTDVRYARFVEYGTSDTAAQPFLRPAADDPGGFAQVAAALLSRVLR